MPASQVLKKFRKGKLHSGSKTGPVVKNLKQAKAIGISQARAEGHGIPKAPSRGAMKARTKRLAKAKV